MAERLVATAARAPLAISIVLVFALAIADSTTGIEITFVVLTYLLPIALATWYRSWLAGIAVAALATACMVSASVPAIINSVGAFCMFGAYIALLDTLRRHVERERMQRRVAVEQLRHAERLNVIGTLAAGVAHELGTPLNVISGAAEMLEEIEPKRERIKELSALILRQTGQVTAIIRHLLDFGRRSGTSVTRVDLDDGVASAVQLLAATARKQGVAIKFAGGIGGDHPVRANGRELEQVVSNLIVNGIQAMPRGGALEISTQVEQRSDHAYGAILVRDEGCGIRREDLPFIFDPFFTTKGVGEGTGLGLSVSYGIVADWGGTLEVSSEVGKGSTFRVLIPLANEVGDSSRVGHAAA